jgi:hypothetical protein
MSSIHQNPHRGQMHFHTPTEFFEPLEGWFLEALCFLLLFLDELFFLALATIMQGTSLDSSVTYPFTILVSRGGFSSSKLLTEVLGSVFFSFQFILEFSRSFNISIFSYDMDLA